MRKLFIIRIFFVPALTALLGFVLLSSCHSSQELIPRSTLKDMLLDMELAEGFVQNIPTDSLHKTISMADSLALYNSRILTYYGHTTSDFSNTMNYYKDHPALLDSLYQDLLTEVTILQSKQKR